MKERRDSFETRSLNQKSKAFKYWNQPLERKRTNYRSSSGLLSHIFFEHDAPNQQMRVPILKNSTEMVTQFQNNELLLQGRIRVVPM